MAEDKNQSDPIAPEGEKVVRGFAMPEVPHLKDIFVGDLAITGRWVVANIDTGISWPVQTQKFRFRGEDIWIIPITQECYGGAAIREREGFDNVACQKLLMRFLSAISWVYEQGISLAHGFGGGSLPRPLGRPGRIGLSITQDFDLTDCPEPANEKALLALALMREGRALAHPGYSFLSFYRVLEVALPDGLRRGEWIKTKIPTLTGHRAKPALAKLRADGIDDIATHLREANRHAIAHAKAEPIIDPDDPSEARRLFQEGPIIEELAELAIEEVLGVETRHTIYRNHLYELAGFKKIIGDDIVRRLKAGEALPDGTTINLPEINMGLRGRAPAEPLKNLKILEVQQHGTRLIILYTCPNNRVQLKIALNFWEERLEFEMLTDIRIHDDGTADGMAAVIAYTEFLNALFLNGQLHVYDAKTGDLLGRKEAYLPLNMMYDQDRASAQLAKMRETEDTRRKMEGGK